MTTAAGAYYYDQPDTSTEAWERLGVSGDDDLGTSPSRKPRFRVPYYTTPTTEKGLPMDPVVKTGGWTEAHLRISDEANSIHTGGLHAEESGFGIPAFEKRLDSTVATLKNLNTRPLPESVEADLQRLAALPAGWDGTSIAAVTEITIERSRFFLQLAYRFGRGRLPEPFLSPAYDGRLILEWQAENGNELIIDVPHSPDGHIRFLLVEPTPTGGESEIESEISDEWSTQAIINRLVGS